MRRLSIAILSVTLLFTMQARAMAGEELTAKVTRQSPTIFRLDLPIPVDRIKGAAIITERLPKGVKMIKCTPDPSVYRKEQGVVKWLIKAPGRRFILEQTLDQAVPVDSLHFSLSFKGGSGEMKTVGYLLENTE